ncbi:MAG: phosphatase PAP2 family protein [Clostridia bacterium]|nr:phosphatase PAP2 family protein [Clostridia bacterium]
MKKEKFKNLYLSIICICAFIIWTVLVALINVKEIGPLGSSVGFSSLNGWFHDMTGVNFSLYYITDWLSLIPVFIMLGFAVLGLVQLFKRKSLFKVDFNILCLGIFYIVVLFAYLLFEEVVINFRPVLINGYLEASYPSSTTMLVMTIMPTAIIQFKSRIKSTTIRNIVVITLIVFTVFMVLARLISGVHWVTDIIGGALISAGLVLMYRFVV